jgi:TetR/AcrR family transcriptional repressor of mexJK operon
VTSKPGSAVFMRDGFAQGSTDAVAAEAGVGKQTIYRHFRSKEAMVEAMCAPEGLFARQQGRWRVDSGFANCC